MDLVGSVTLLFPAVEFLRSAHLVAKHHSIVSQEVINTKPSSDPVHSVSKLEYNVVQWSVACRLRLSEGLT